MSFSSLSSSHVSSFRFTLIPPKSDLSSLSTFTTMCLSIARFSAISCVLARDLSSSKSMSSVQCIASTPQCARIASSACLSSVAANYAEASEAESPADFVHKLKLVQKELKESRVWLLFASRLSPGEVVESLRSESRELLLMIGKSINTALARTKDNTIGA